MGPKRGLTARVALTLEVKVDLVCAVSAIPQNSAYRVATGREYLIFTVSTASSQTHLQNASHQRTVAIGRLLL